VNIFGDINLNHVSIYLARLFEADVSHGQDLIMSDDDRAAKAARAKALVRLSSFEMHRLTLLPPSSTKRGSKRNRGQAPARQRRQLQARRWSEPFPLPL
jgi:hypothetical protein